MTDSGNVYMSVYWILFISHRIRNVTGKLLSVMWKPENSIQI